MVDILKKRLDCTFEEALETVKKKIEKEFSILMVKSIDGVIRKKLDLPEYPVKYTTILACGPEIAKMSLDISMDIGTLMPCSFVVYEDKGEVFVAHISIMKIASELEIAGGEEMKPVIEKTGEKVKKVWEEL
ncbi:MAG: DUF302 domain-containing protein [Candidatus Hadarchaeota archaeon]